MILFILGDLEKKPQHKKWRYRCSGGIFLYHFSVFIQYIFPHVSA